MTEVRVSPWQFARLWEGIQAARNAGYGPRRATASGIIYAGIKINPESFGEYKIIVDWSKDKTT